MIPKKTQIALAVALQMFFIGAVGDFLHWPYMNYVYAVAAVSFVLAMIFFVTGLYKD